MKKKLFFFINLFFAFFVIQVLENSEFLTWVYMIGFGYLDRLPRKEEIYANFHKDRPSFSGITQEIQDGFKMFLSINSVFIRKFDFFPENNKFEWKKVKQCISQTKNIESTNNWTVVMPPVFEVSTFKLILKHVCAHNFLWDLHNTRF